MTRKTRTPRSDTESASLRASESARFTPDQVRRRRAIALRVSVTVIVAVGLLFVVVFPVRAWMDQRSSLARSERRLDALHEERARLERAARRFADNTEIERLARQNYGMIKPGEQAWVAVPVTSTTTTSTTLPLAP